MFIDTSTWVKGGELPSTFNVKSRHTKYDEMLPYWQKCRDARKGAKAMKDGANCERYLPRLDSQVLQSVDNDKTPTQKNREYANYKNRAIWYGATGKTVEAFKGMIYQKPVKYFSKNTELPKDFIESDLMRYASQEDESFSALMQACTDEILTVNRVGILEDYPVLVDEETGEAVQMSQLDFEKSGITSYSVKYLAEQITNWGIAIHKGRKVESFYVLEESWLDYEESQSSPKQRLRWRLLLLEPMNGDLVYKQVIIIEDKDDKIKIQDIFYPLFNGNYFNYIPFWCLSVNGNQLDEISEPEILDLVEMNIGHFRNSADYENEMHYVSIKTAIFPGWEQETYGNPVLGGALATPPEQKPFILEASSTSGLAGEMKAKEEKMAILGAQMLSAKGRYIQSATTSEIENQGQSGILGSLAATLEEFFSVILSLKMEWSGQGKEGVKVVLNKEYMKNTVAPEIMKDLVAAVQAGKMSFKTFYYNISKLDMYPDGWTEEDEMNAIDSEGLGMASQDILTALDTANKRIMALEGKKPDPVKDKGAAA
jgi:hypothetical protein